MANETVTVYIDDSSLRLMVTQGRRIKEWAESLLEPGVVENNIVINEAKLADNIKQLFQIKKIKTRKIVLGLSGFRCLTRPIVFPRLPKEMLDEAIRRELQRVLDVPTYLEELYLSWQTMPSSAEQTQVFVVGIPRQAADSMFKALQKAGLKVSFLQIKPLLLARAIKEQTAIIIDVQATELDIVVMFEGVPQRVRSARFTSGDLSSEEKLATITNELNRNLSWYTTNNPEKPLAAGVPVFTSGDLANESVLYQPLSAEVGHPFLPLPSPLECPEGLDPSHYMVNIGLAFQETASKEKLGTKAFASNALPDVYQTKTVSLSNVLVLPGAVVSVGLLAFLVMFYQSVSADINSLNTKLTITNQTVQQKQTQRQQLSANASTLHNQISAATTNRDSIINVLSIFADQAAATNNDLATATENLPQNVTLTNVSHVGNVLTVTGIAKAEDQVSDYISKLNSSGRFGNIVITDMTRNNGGINFTLVGTAQPQSIGASSAEIALGSLPSSLTLTNVKSVEGVLIIDGVSPTSDKIFSYLRTLEASGKFSEITVTSVTSNKAGGMDFSLVLKSGG